MDAMAAALDWIDKEGIPGDIVECGVWRGGNIILSRMLSPNRICWLYDTFDGMTMPEDIDRTRGGRKAIDSYLGKKKPGGKWAAVTVEDVRANLHNTGTLDDDHLRFVEGKVEDTLLNKKNLPDQIALLRLDTDWYASTKIELEVLYPRLMKRGILIIDDYGHWLGARQAVDDYFINAPPIFAPIDYSAVMLTKS